MSWSLTITEAAYAEQIVPIVPFGTRYDWYVETNTDALRAAGFTSLSTALDNVERQIMQLEIEREALKKERDKAYFVYQHCNLLTITFRRNRAGKNQNNSQVTWGSASDEPISECL